MACGPNLAPGRCDVPPSNGAPMIMMSVPAHEARSARSARATPRKVASGPYIPPSLVISLPPACSFVPARLGSNVLAMLVLSALVRVADATAPQNHEGERARPAGSPPQVLGRV